jgi:hypothetical protein
LGIEPCQLICSGTTKRTFKSGTLQHHTQRAAGGMKNYGHKNQYLYTKTVCVGVCGVVIVLLVREREMSYNPSQGSLNETIRNDLRGKPTVVVINEFLK